MQVLGTGFRAPDSNARFGFGGNPNLREEISRTIELGMNYDINSLNTRATSIRAYENKIEDLIETILIDPGAFTFENRNVNDARITRYGIFIPTSRLINGSINIEGVTSKSS